MQHKGAISEFAIASLIIGLLSFVPLGLANLGCAILAIILGVLALKKIAAPESELRGEGLAASGIVSGAICTLMISIFLYILIKKPELLEEFLQQHLPR